MMREDGYTLVDPNCSISFLLLALLVFSLRRIIKTAFKWIRWCILSDTLVFVSFEHFLLLTCKHDRVWEKCLTHSSERYRERQRQGEITKDKVAHARRFIFLLSSTYLTNIYISFLHKVSSCNYLWINKTYRSRVKYKWACF